MNLFPSDTPMPVRLETIWRNILSGHYYIRNKSARRVQFKPKPMQERLFASFYRQAKAGRPLRMIDLKPRKVGCSTVIQIVNFGLAQYTPDWQARTVAHTEASTRDIHGIAQYAARHLEYGPEPTTKVNPINFEHGSSLSTGTAGGVYVQSGATTNFSHLSELAKWPGNENSVMSQVVSILNSVPDDPFSIICIESTANMHDVSGEFSERWAASKAGDSPYEPFFTNWLEDPDYCVQGAEIIQADEYEQWLRAEFGATDGQLAWRRRKIAGDFRGDVTYFMQEYPATEREAFQVQVGRIFPMLNEERHVACLTPAELSARGYEFYRGIDFGGADPFVCLWAAHHPGPPSLTIDREACPHTWREMERYQWDSNNRPVDKDDHTIDALRYIVMHNNLEGHVHVYRELYEPDSAVHSRSVLDQARTIVNLTTGAERVIGDVADRSQPGTIVLLNQQGIPAEPNRVPTRISERGEKIDGINVMQALLLATEPLSQPRPPETIQDHNRKFKEEMASIGVSIGFSSDDLRVGAGSASGDVWTPDQGGWY